MVSYCIITLLITFWYYFRKLVSQADNKSCNLLGRFNESRAR